MSTTTTTTASQVRLSPGQLGICGSGDSPVGSLEVVNRLLQKNHDEFHIFWKDVNGHNHTAHNLLTSFALGATPAQLEQGFVDNLRDQRPRPELDNDTVQKLHDEGYFYENIGEIKQYTNFLVFFERQMEEKGWRAVITEYCFSRTRVAEALLSRMFDGAYHPIIHLGLGVEFEQPSIIAEALAQAAAHESLGVDVFFRNCEQEVLKAAPRDPTQPSRPFVDLLHEAYANETIRHSSRWEDVGVNKMKEGVLGRGGPAITALAAQVHVEPEALEEKTAEMINCCAYFAGAAQRAGKQRKIDFFYMHSVTSSIFLTVLTRQPWISTAMKVRLVEWKVRVDLVWYATCGAAELQLDYVRNYEAGPSSGMDWRALFGAVNALHDDGHVGKFVRALKNGEEVCKPFEHGKDASSFPIKGDMWLKLGQMAYDSTANVPEEAKWVPFTGFDLPWSRVPPKQ